MNVLYGMLFYIDIHESNLLERRGGRRIKACLFYFNDRFFFLFSQLHVQPIPIIVRSITTRSVEVAGKSKV